MAPHHLYCQKMLGGPDHILWLDFYDVPPVRNGKGGLVLGYGRTDRQTRGKINPALLRVAPQAPPLFVYDSKVNIVVVGGGGWGTQFRQNVDFL